MLFHITLSQDLRFTIYILNPYAVYLQLMKLRNRQRNGVFYGVYLPLSFTISFTIEYRISKK